jgi:hypothetical protein
LEAGGKVLPQTSIEAILKPGAAEGDMPQTLELMRFKENGNFARKSICFHSKSSKYGNYRLILRNLFLICLIIFPKTGILD